jgi:predicted phosphate transport protein (TIGR00153 family)
MHQSVNASRQALKAINELDELLETGFSGREVKFVEGMINELNDLETQNDQTQIELRKILFEIEADIPPIEVMFLYQIFDKIGELADFSQKVGSRLLLLLAR